MNYKVGDRVICNGHEGAIREMCTGQLEGMAVVALERGQVCVDIHELAHIHPIVNKEPK